MRRSRRPGHLPAPSRRAPPAQPLVLVGHVAPAYVSSASLPALLAPLLRGHRVVLVGGHGGGDLVRAAQKRACPLIDLAVEVHVVRGDRRAGAHGAQQRRVRAADRVPVDVGRGVGVELVEQHLVPDAAQEPHPRSSPRGACTVARCTRRRTARAPTTTSGLVRRARRSRRRSRRRGSPARTGRPRGGSCRGVEAELGQPVGARVDQRGAVGDVDRSRPCSLRMWSAMPLASAIERVGQPHRHFSAAR